jgi:hypothetical protein
MPNLGRLRRFAQSHKEETSKMTFEGIHRFDLGSIRFAFYPDGNDGGRILADISEQTLSHVFGNRLGGESWIDLCGRHRDLLAAEALVQYRIDPSRPIELAVKDFAAFRGASATSTAVSAPGR